MFKGRKWHVKEGDVVVPLVDQGFYWERGVASTMGSRAGWLIWTRCPAGWIAGTTMGQIPSSRFRLATPEERTEILQAMKGIPFDGPEDDKEMIRRSAYWQPVFDQVLKPLIDSV